MCERSHSSKISLQLRHRHIKIIYNKIHGLSFSVATRTPVPCRVHNEYNGAHTLLLLMPILPLLISLCKIITSGVFVLLSQPSMAAGALALSPSSSSSSLCAVVVVVRNFYRLSRIRSHFELSFHFRLRRHFNGIFVFALSFADSDSLQDVPAVQTQDEEEKNMKRK